jgi:hypothetical protein
MADRPSGLLTTVTLRRCWPAATAQGATALVLDILESEPIAFALSPEIIAGLRKALTKAEELMARTQGQA